ncbi:group II truncated hemoglobin [Sphingomonas sp. MMS12-HWE2-04]|uniref:group II truncated hemoglobin n=1 Tax=Sphingomonas sp. MMS12-HWE2-04 TaxID=3234199 RepID=UPI00384A5679
MPESPVPSLFDRIGGEDGVRALVDRFYDLMDDHPDYAQLRAMHDSNLFPMRVSLTQFLAAWLGGPRTWFDVRPGACIMSAHRGMGISRQTAAQWVHAMSRAMAESRVDPAVGAQMQASFLRMANAMLLNARDQEAHR